VKTGKRYDQHIEIISGLTPGTRILTGAISEISDGVKILEDDSPGNTP
jgi:hypothetical protein